MEATIVQDKTKHYPVLLKEIISIISPQYGGTFIDCTFGQGGYTREILKNKDNKVFYCQYAYARASSVINKENELGIKIKKDYNFTEIQNLSDEEVKLIKKLICYPYLLYQSSYYNEPHRLINYLEEISSDFHSIWNKGKDNESLRFIDEKNAEKTISKIFWLESFRVILKDIFSIIDISAPETM